MRVKTFQNGDSLHAYEGALVLEFAGRRATVSTSPLCGGVRSDLRCIFVKDEKRGAGTPIEPPTEDPEKNLELAASSLGLPAGRATGFSTLADAASPSISSSAFKILEVTAAACCSNLARTAYRAGETARYPDASGPPARALLEGGATILLHINLNLTPGALVRCMVTATEAKTAALQELMIPAPGGGFATGFGTDRIAVACDSESAHCLTDAGKHVMLGELIGKNVKAAVRAAVLACREGQYGAPGPALERLARFGIGIKEARPFMPDGQNAAEFEQMADSALTEPMDIWAAMMVSHILDQLEWGMLSEEEACSAAARILSSLSGESCLPGSRAEIIALLARAYATRLQGSGKERG
jgi:adenosylcobinamide amidohydrolase